MAKKKRKKKTKIPFYETENWKYLRVAIWKIFPRKCLKCSTIDGIFHVDHVYPKSKFPSLSLEIGNLQPLCEQCNMEKSNLNSKDYRTDDDILSIEDMRESDPRLVKIAKISRKWKKRKPRKKKSKKPKHNKNGIFDKPRKKKSKKPKYSKNGIFDKPFQPKTILRKQLLRS